MTKAQQTYERIEKLVTDGSKRPDAFKKLAEELGQSVDSVRGAYYTGRRQATGSSEPARGGRSRRRRETTPEDAIDNAVKTLEQAIEQIEQDVKLANERADETQLEYDAIREAAGPRIAEIKAKIAALKGDQA